MRLSLGIWQRAREPSTRLQVEDRTKSQLFNKNTVSWRHKAAIKKKAIANVKKKKKEETDVKFFALIMYYFWLLLLKYKELSCVFMQMATIGNSVWIQYEFK